MCLFDYVLYFLNPRQEFVPNSLYEKVWCCLRIAHKIKHILCNRSFLKMEDCRAALSYILVNIGRLCNWFVGDCHINHWKLLICLAFSAPHVMVHSISAFMCLMEATLEVLSGCHLCFPEKVHVHSSAFDSFRIYF